MDRYSDQLYELKFPKDFAQKQRDRMAQYRKENFKNIIRKTPFVEFYAMSPWSSEELETIGIQWFSGINSPSRWTGYPNQAYWQTHSLVFMFRNKRWRLTVRGKKMPYKNYGEYLFWHKQRRKIQNNNVIDE